MTILEPMSSGVIVVKFAADFVAVWFPRWLGGGSSAVVRREEKAWAADLSGLTADSLAGRLQWGEGGALLKTFEICKKEIKNLFLSDSAPVG